jgi:hypothetical protein
MQSFRKYSQVLKLGVKKFWYDKETCVSPLYEIIPVIKQAEKSRVHEPKKTKENGHLQSPSIPFLK